MNKPDKRATRILIVDDHPVIQAGLMSMLATHPEVKVMGSASSGEEALARMEEDMPDIVLLDLRMPGMTGIDVLRAMREKKASARAIILTSFETDENIYRAIQVGAHGYLLKDTSQREMLQAIATVHAGRKYIPGQIAARLAERMMRSSLTARELEILNMLSKGLTNKQIGRVLNISDNTVRNHVNSILEKLEVADRTEAVTVAIQQGIIQIDS
ncbi:MAG TPA: response regulator transcription factor [Acidobacteriaceae bacterium]|jgi:DNA-binding NarL/FixJ family response regulator|nr:response regulator transcription factor [Acidobacteriaceae bacterium]